MLMTKEETEMKTHVGFMARFMARFMTLAELGESCKSYDQFFIN